MLDLLDLRGDRSDATARLPRAAAAAVEEVRAVVREVLDAVRAEGDDAVLRYAKAFDGFDGAEFEIPPERLDAAVAALSPALRAAIDQAVTQVRWFHERSRPEDWSEERGGGVRLGVRHAPLRRVGVYVPGGRAPLASSAMMTVVPAKVAGVDEIILATPPGPDGEPDESILAMARICGADRVLAIGGAQAIAALAYGTTRVPRCDKIVGPGNAYVAEAKALVASEGVVGIDAFAGVTEVAIIADDTAQPVHVAADLVGQAEHDPDVTAILITPSAELARAVEEAVQAEVAATRHRERVTAALTSHGTIVLVDDLDHAVEVADAFAAEHLEVHTADADAVAARVRAAGCVFIGPHTPVSVGDYGAGPNHTLPTAGTARFTGGLATSDFLVPINTVAYDERALAAMAPVVEALGYAEDLPAHVRAVEARFTSNVAPPPSSEQASSRTTRDDPRSTP